MTAVEVPPDATVFVSGGVTRYLYMGLKEIKAIQQKWGLDRKPGESQEAYAKKCVAFQERMNSEEWEDRRDIMLACLGPWAAAAGNGSGPVQITEDEALRIFEGAQLHDRKGKGKRFAPAYRFAALWNRFSLDMMGMGPDDEPEESDDPKAPAREGSTQSGSSPKA